MPGGPPRRSIRDVAERAGVSVGTVSNVLNRPALVAEHTRRRVEQAIADLHFIRNGPARQLRAGVSQTVGAVVLDIGNPFFTDVTRGIEDGLAARDRVLMLCSSDGRPEKEDRHLRLLEEQGVGGVLVTPAGAEIPRLAELRARGIIPVLLDRPSPDDSCCSVAVDDVRGGELAASHLLTLGHRRIALVNGPLDIRQCADRRAGVHRALRRAGLAVADVLVEVPVGTLAAESGEQALPAVLAADPPVGAVICVNDLVALGVLRGLFRRGIAVPEQVAVVGYDDVDFAAVLMTPLTSVRQPRYELGRAAAELLLAEVDDGPAHQHRQVLFQPELVVRASSAGSAEPGTPATRTAAGAAPPNQPTDLVAS